MVATRRDGCYTSQAIRSRLRQGFDAVGLHGYHGYQWKHPKEAWIWIWCFPGGCPEHVETIEAELVFLIRANTDRWPEFQTEIHFHQSSEAQRRTAEAMFRQLVGASDGITDTNLRSV